MEKKLENFLNDNKIKINMMFVPFSFSRNHKEKNKTINWIIRIESSKDSMLVEYSTGIGFLPDYNLMQKQRLLETTRIAKVIDEAVETGTMQTIKSDGSISIVKKGLSKPNEIDILNSLCLGSSVLNLTFKEWVEEYGYDKNSIKDQDIYQKCLSQSEDFLKILGGRRKMEELTKIIYDIENHDIEYETNKINMKMKK